MDKLPEIKIGKRSIPLYYSTYETIAIQREIGCTAFQLKDTVFGTETIDEDKDITLDNIRLTVDKDPDKMEKLGKLIDTLSTIDADALTASIQRFNSLLEGLSNFKLFG